METIDLTSEIEPKAKLKYQITKEPENTQDEHRNKTKLKPRRNYKNISQQ
jgi:hypothetical protein